MGNGSSSPAASVASTALDVGAGSARRSRFASLPSTGRYWVVTAPAAGNAPATGGRIHVLGVVPCSSISEEEAFDLVSATSPAAVYIDVHPEILTALCDEVSDGKLPGSYTPSENPPKYHKYKDAGYMSSIRIRQIMADNEMFALLGAEALGAFKAAITATEPHRGGVKLLAFPYRMDYNNSECLERPSHLATILTGNAAQSSDAVTAIIGNLYKMDQSTPPEVQFTAEIPRDTNYFTRSQVSALQDRFRMTVNAATKNATLASMDVEAYINSREEEARKAQDMNAMQVFQVAGLRSQFQSQAVAHVLKEAAAEAAGRDVVAIVNLGMAASLKRNWEEARPPMEIHPPLSPLLQGVAYGAQAVVVGGVGYGFYRSFRRFPKTTGVVGAVVAAGVGLTAMGMVYAETFMYGQWVRTALARPRITSPVANVGR